MCKLNFETDVYDKDWACGKKKRDIKYDSIADNWTGFLITWDVTLYGDISLSTQAGGAQTQ